MPYDQSALIIVDVQNDFCPGGALAVPDGDQVVPVIAGLMDRFETIILTQDWHPKGHSSFASSYAGKNPFDMTVLDYGDQVLWPDHCVQGTKGAAFHPDLDVNRAQLVIRKGFRTGIDSYSAFYENDRKTVTGLTGYLQNRGIKDLYFCGLATDFCVGFSALDAVTDGFQATLIEDACRGIDLDGSMQMAHDNMVAANVRFVQSDRL